MDCIQRDDVYLVLLVNLHIKICVWKLGNTLKGVRVQGEPLPISRPGVLLLGLSKLHLSAMAYLVRSNLDK